MPRDIARNLGPLSDAESGFAADPNYARPTGVTPQSALPDVQCFFNVSRVIVPKNVPKGIKVEPALNMCWGTKSYSDIKPRGRNAPAEAITFKDPQSPQSVDLRAKTDAAASTGFDKVAKAYNISLVGNYGNDFMNFIKAEEGAKDEAKISGVYEGISFGSAKKYTVETPNQAPEMEGSRWERLLACVNDKNDDGEHKSPTNIRNQLNAMAEEAYRRLEAAGIDGSNFEIKDKNGNFKRLPVHVSFDSKFPGEDPNYNNSAFKSFQYGLRTEDLPLEPQSKGPMTSKMKTALANYAYHLVKCMLSAVTTDTKGEVVKVSIPIQRTEKGSKTQMKVARGKINGSLGGAAKVDPSDQQFVRFMYPHPEEVGFFRAEDMIRTIVVEFEPLVHWDGKDVKMGNKFSSAALGQAYMQSRASKLRHYVVVCVYSDMDSVQYIDATAVDSVRELDAIRKKAYESLVRKSGKPLGKAFPKPLLFAENGPAAAAAAAIFPSVSSLVINDGMVSGQVDPKNVATTRDDEIMELIKTSNGAKSSIIQGVLTQVLPNSTSQHGREIYDRIVSDTNLIDDLANDPILGCTKEGQSNCGDGIIVIKRGSKQRMSGFAGIVGNLRANDSADVLLRQFLARLPKLSKADITEFLVPNAALDNFKTNALGGHLGTTSIGMEVDGINSETVRQRHVMGVKTQLQFRPIKIGNTGRIERMIIAPRVNQIFQRLKLQLGNKSLQSMEQHEIDTFNSMLTMFFDNTTQHFNLLYVSIVLDRALRAEKIIGKPATNLTPRETQVVFTVRNLCQRLLDLVAFAHELGRDIFINVIINDVLGRIIQIVDMSTSMVTQTPVGYGLEEQGLINYKDNIIESCYAAIFAIGAKHQLPGGMVNGNVLFGYSLTDADRKKDDEGEKTFAEALRFFNKLASDLKSLNQPARLGATVVVTALGGPAGMRLDGVETGVNADAIKDHHYRAFVLGDELWLKTWTFGPDISDHLVLGRADKDEEQAKLLYGDKFVEEVERMQLASQTAGGFFAGDVLQKMDTDIRYISPSAAKYGAIDDVDVDVSGAKFARRSEAEAARLAQELQEMQVG